MTTSAVPTITGLCARAALVASLLAEPVDAPRLWQMRDETFAAQWGRRSPEADRAFALLRESAAAHESVGRLETDFTRLFAAPEVRLDPRASAYRADLRPEDLVELYESVGVRPAGTFPPDHLVTELRFVAQLEVAGTAPLALLVDFAREHLRPWAGECLAELSLRAGSLFYQGIGVLGMDYIESLPTR